MYSEDNWNEYLRDSYENRERVTLHILALAVDRANQKEISDPDSTTQSVRDYYENIQLGEWQHV